MSDSFILEGKTIRLEPLEARHIDGLVQAAQEDPSPYQWSPVPRDYAQACAYVATAASWRKAAAAVPFAIVRGSDDIVVGSTRFWNCERWAWPVGHASSGRTEPDACEIGYTWLARSSMRTGANTEAKALLLTHAFETWRTLRVCLHTDIRNTRSQVAIERIGGHFEGILRAHRIAADATPRDSARYSIIAAEWTVVKARLAALMTARSQAANPWT